MLTPGAFGTAFVAVGLFAMATLLAVRIGWFSLPASPAINRVVRTGAWLIAGLFALRAVGDFRYVGFFKRIRDSRFARLDTLAYYPSVRAWRCWSAPPLRDESRAFIAETAEPKEKRGCI